MHVCNRDLFGYVPDKLKQEEDEEKRHDLFVHLKNEHLLNGPNKSYLKPLSVSKFMDPTLKVFRKYKSKLNFDQIYVINLERRTDRRDRIEATLNELNLNFKLFKAVDAKQMNEEYLKQLGVGILPNYVDPYSGRPMNYGEIGCFLSHYFIWKEVGSF